MTGMKLMALRKDGNPKKKGGWHLAKYKLILEPKKTEAEREADAYDWDKLKDIKAYKDKQLLRRM
jgi:hypothetical protein